MKFLLMLFSIFALFSCKSKKASPATGPRVQLPAEIADTVTNFFPVTSYLKGELLNIRTGGIAPIRKITIGKHTDSAWVKEADYQKIFADFLSPIIDTANLKGFFTEKKFLDQTLNAFTFSYDPLNAAADTFAFRRWDVYIDPDNNKVRRIYLVKKIDDSHQLQLTWQSGKWCKIITLKTTGDDTEIEKEEKISWTYDEQ